MRVLIVPLLFPISVALGADASPLQARLDKMKDFSVCEEAGRVSRNTDSSPRAQQWQDLVLARVKKNGWMSDKEMAFARDRRLFIGMSTCGAVASLGRPERINTTTYPQGKLSQWAYDGRGRTRYLHFADQVLASFDD